jgi:glutaredoxin 3
MAAQVEVYVTTYCPYCIRAKALLQKKGVPFKEIDVSNDDAKRAWLMKASGQRTVPQIFINGKSVGGSDDIHALDRAGKLDALLAESPTLRVGWAPRAGPRITGRWEGIGVGLARGRSVASQVASPRVAATCARVS